jgi:thiol:disulfide interchange protein DsbC
MNQIRGAGSDGAAPSRYPIENVMLKKLLIALTLLAAAASAPASDSHAADSAEQTVRAAMHSLLPMTKIDEVVKSDLPGFYEVIVSGQVVYVTADGKYLLQGNLYNVAQKQDLTAARVASMREQAVQKLPASKKLVFAPAHPKHTVTVFTDVDCPYCRAFHKNIAEYNKAGIAVNYVLFPLEIHPGADKKAAAVWCSKDRNAAYTAAMDGHDPGNDTSCANPVAETKALGLALGINATPTVLAEDGSQVDLGKATSPALLAAELDRLAAAANKGSAPVAAR